MIVEWIVRRATRRAGRGAGREAVRPGSSHPRPSHVPPRPGVMTVLICLALAGVALAGRVEAQGDAGRAGPSPVARDTACTYDRCALRIEGGKVVRGARGTRVAGLGLFSGVAGRVRWTSDSALRYARSYRSNHTGAGVMKVIAFAGSVAGAVLLVQAYTEARDRNATGEGTVGLDRSKLHAVYGVAIGSTAFGFVGGLLEGHARKQLSRAIWWHNRDLPR
jgi:hypothetical protein